jgi:hypothetical protein
MMDKQITLKTFDEMVEEGCFDFLETEIDCPLSLFLDEIRGHVKRLIAWRSNPPSHKTQSDARKQLSKLRSVIDSVLLNDDAVGLLAVELHLREALDHKRYFPGHRDPPTEKHPQGVLTCFDEQGALYPGENTDLAETLRIVLQGIGASCSFSETAPVKKGRPENQHNYFATYCLLRYATSRGITDITANETPDKAFFRMMQMIFPEQSPDAIKKMIGKFPSMLSS